MSIHHMCGWGLHRSEEDVRSPETEVSDGCEPPYGFLKLNLCPLGEQQVLLPAEQSLWQFKVSFKRVY